MFKVFDMMNVYMKRYKWRISLYMILCLSASAFSLITPYITGKFLDSLLSSRSYIFLYRYCFLYFGIFILNIVLKGVSSRLYLKLQMRIGHEFNKNVVQHIHRIDSLVSENTDASFLSQQINNDTNELVMFTLSLPQNVITNLLVFLLQMIIISRINFYVTMFVAAAVVIYFLIYFFSRRMVYQGSEMVKMARSIYFAKLYEQLRYSYFIKLHSAYMWFYRRLGDAFDTLSSACIHQQNISLAISSLNSLILAFMRVSIFFMGGKAIIDGSISVGQFTIVSSYFSMMTGSIGFFTGLGKTLQEILVSYNRIQDILEIPEAKNGDYRLKTVDKISLEHINFAYGSNIIYKENSLVFERSKLYLIKGRNGSGKSTLVNILAGIYGSSSSKNIFFDTKNMSILDMEDYRNNMLAVCEQNVRLVADTFLNNVTMGNPKGIDYRKLDWLIEQFGLEGILGEPRGKEKYNLFINEKNSNLSGGEKQKISIIRTLIKNTDIMIFDEPTTALDEKSKEIFCQLLRKVKDSKIIIVVSHEGCFDNIADFVIDVDSIRVDIKDVG